MILKANALNSFDQLVLATLVETGPQSLPDFSKHISRNALASGSRVVRYSEPDAIAYRLIFRADTQQHREIIAAPILKPAMRHVVLSVRWRRANRGVNRATKICDPDQSRFTRAFSLADSLLTFAVVTDFAACTFARRIADSWSCFARIRISAVK